jgi:hypothetical protein
MEQTNDEQGARAKLPKVACLQNQTDLELHNLQQFQAGMNTQVQAQMQFNLNIQAYMQMQNSLVSEMMLYQRQQPQLQQFMQFQQSPSFSPTAFIPVHQQQQSPASLYHQQQYNHQFHFQLPHSLPAAQQLHAIPTGGGRANFATPARSSNLEKGHKKDRHTKAGSISSIDSLVLFFEQTSLHGPKATSVAAKKLLSQGIKQAKFKWRNSTVGAWVLFCFAFCSCVRMCVRARV